MGWFFNTFLYQITYCANVGHLLIMCARDADMKYDEMETLNV